MSTFRSTMTVSSSEPSSSRSTVVPTAARVALSGATTMWSPRTTTSTTCSTHNIQDHLPIQILDKLTGSRCLFLGYVLRNWNARVFLRRIWKGNADQ